MPVKYLDLARRLYKACERLAERDLDLAIKTYWQGMDILNSRYMPDV